MSLWGNDFKHSFLLQIIMKCIKCCYETNNLKKKCGLPFCSICFAFAPSTPEEVDSYAGEKIDGKLLETFRKNSVFLVEKRIRSMKKKASIGKPMARPPFGYNFSNGKLIPSQNSDEVREIFEEFLNTNISLRALSRKHHFTVNGIKKILTNFTYLGKVKFDKEIHSGQHQPLVSSTLFNHVQNKLEKLGIKKI